jgi:hypothetical protein
MSLTSHNQISVSNTLGKNALTNNDFFFGVTGGDDYGPTSDSGFYNGVPVSVGGYVIYFNNVGTITANAPKDDNECIYWLKRYGYTGADNISDALTWASGQTHLAVLSSQYELSDLPSGYSFTLNSSDIQVAYGNYNSWNGHEYPVALGTDGVDGFSLTFYAGQPSDFTKASYVPYIANIGSQTIIDFFYNLVVNNILPYAHETTLWNVQWGPGSTHASGVVSLRGVGGLGQQMYMAPLDTTDSSWNQSGNNTIALEGTYYFPATFTLIEPVTDKGGWC